MAALPRRALDELLVEPVDAHPGVEDERLRGEARGPGREEEERGVRDLAGLERALPERRRFRVEVALEITRDPRRGRRLQRTRADRVEAHAGSREALRQENDRRIERGLDGRHRAVV